MSKKNTLNEVRRFMALANLDTSLSSNFITKLEETDMSYMRDDEEEMMQEEEADEEEEEMDMDMEMDMEVEAEPEMGDEEMDMEMDMDMEVEAEPEEEAVLTDDEADAIIALADKLRAARDGDGVDDLDSEEEIEFDAEEEMPEEEETLEEILNDVLGEEMSEDEEDQWFAGKSAADIELAQLQKRAAKEPEHDRDKSAGKKAIDRVRSRKRETPRLNEEDLVQEVLRRVKTRLKEMKNRKE